MYERVIPLKRDDKMTRKANLNLAIVLAGTLLMLSASSGTRSTHLQGEEGAGTAARDSLGTHQTVIRSDHKAPRDANSSLLDLISVDKDIPVVTGNTELTRMR
jgi:hypothetical protein